MPRSLPRPLEARTTGLSYKAAELEREVEAAEGTQKLEDSENRETQSSRKTWGVAMSILFSADWQPETQWEDR